ncbi:hypothetical protein ABZ281_31915 [Streptomyces sp. NPDC006265]|uniref:hypothetical protein n=1 Tax=Streptomyces sp. NPDC006265 TaxID=3156740 RepID=UPI0033A517BA
MTDPFPPHLDGAVIPGGCPDCNAEQHIRQDQPGIWAIGIHHDDTCPTWHRIENQRAGIVPDTFRR